MKNTKNIILYSILGGLFIAPFIAFIVPSGMFFPFITGKGFVFRIMVEVVFGLYIALAFFDKEYRPKFSWITKAVLLFTVVILIADLLGENAYKSIWSNFERMEGFMLVLHLTMYYIVASSVINTKALWNKFLNTFIITSFIMSLYAVLQLMGQITINQGGNRVDATFGNSAYFSIFLVFHIFLCMYMLVSSAKQVWLKRTYIGVAVLETIILYFTATRGAILGLIGGLLLMGVLVLWKPARNASHSDAGGEREDKNLRKVAYSIIGGVVVVVLGFMAIRSTSYVQHSMVLSRFANLSVSEIQTQGRYYVWPMAVKGVMERPILGWGQENFNFVFNKYYDPGLFGQEEWFDRTHDLVLDWLIAGGVLGFLAYASIYVALFYYIWRRKSELKLFEKSILTGMVFAYVFHNLFVFDNLISYIIFFSILAYLHLINTSKEVETKGFYVKTFSHNTLNYVVIPVVGVLTVLMIYFVNVPAMLANTTLIQAITPQKDGGLEKNLALFKQVYAYNSFGSTEATEQLTQLTPQLYSSQSQVPENIKKEFYDLAKSKLEEKTTQTPTDARYLVFAGSFFNHFAQYEEAIKYLDRALVQSPEKESIFFELGTSYLGKKDFSKMLELFKEGYDLKPSSSESQVVYAVGAIYARDSAVLQKLSSQIDQSLVISDNRILKAYADTEDYNTVIAILNARLSKDPTNMQYKLSLASAYATAGQKQKAISIIREMIAEQPSFKDQGEQYIKQIGG